MKIIGIVGWSGSGKTTVLRRLIPALAARGISVSTLKHAHHAFDVDQPGKDSHEHRMAGAREVLIASRNRWALMHELRDEAEWNLRALLGRLAPVDLVLIEGFKTETHPKIEVYRLANGRPPLFPGDGTVRAVCTDAPAAGIDRPVIGLDDIEALADAVLAHSVSLAVFLATGGDGGPTQR